MLWNKIKKKIGHQYWNEDNSLNLYKKREIIDANIIIDDEGTVQITDNKVKIGWKSFNQETKKEEVFLKNRNG